MNAPSRHVGLILNFESVRFLLAGGTASFVNWLSRFAFSVVLPFPVAVILAAAVGLGIGFISYRLWVWPGSSVGIRMQLARFLAVNIGSAIVVFLVSVPLAAILKNQAQSVPVAEGVAHACGIAAGAIITFLGHRTFTFARAK
jgi:energy-coupling factor transport system substrate-specific component